MVLETPDQAALKPLDSTRRFHRWAAILGLILISNFAVLSRGLGVELVSFLALISGLFFSFMAFCGISVSVIYPPAIKTEEGMWRQYTLLVALELLSFVLVFGISRFFSEFLIRPVYILIGVIWLSLQLILLYAAAEETTEELKGARRITLGTLAGMALWILFCILCDRLFPDPESTKNKFSSLVNVLVMTPCVSVFFFVLSTTLTTSSTTLLTWGRASTAYMLTLPTLLAFSFILGIIM